MIVPPLALVVSHITPMGLEISILSAEYFLPPPLEQRTLAAGRLRLHLNEV